MDYMVDFSSQFAIDFAFAMVNNIILAGISPILLFANLFI